MGRLFGIHMWVICLQVCFHIFLKSARSYAVDNSPLTMCVPEMEFTIQYRL